MSVKNIGIFYSNYSQLIELWNKHKVLAKREGWTVSEAARTIGTPYHRRIYGVINTLEDAGRFGAIDFHSLFCNIEDSVVCEYMMTRMRQQ